MNTTKTTIAATATACAATLKRINFCERLGDPPCIMFHRPRKRISATTAQTMRMTISMGLRL